MAGVPVFWRTLNDIYFQAIVLKRMVLKAGRDVNRTAYSYP
jgi:hypothetical protein